MYCKNCGKEVADGADFCLNCGAKIDKDPAPAGAVGDQFKQAAEDAFKAPVDDTASYDAQDISSNKAMAILSYFGFLVLIPMFAAKESRFARFHANQGLILFIAEVAVNILSSIVTGIIKAVLIGAGLYSLGFIVTIISLLFTLCNIAIAVLAIMGIVYAAQGKAKELPVVGKFKILK